MIFREVVEKKFPFGNFPELVALVPVKTDHVRGDHIELAAEIGQRLIRLDPPDHSLHAEQVDHLREAALLIEIHPENVVAEQLADVEKIAGAAPDIEDAFAAAEIEAEIAHALEVDLHPALDLEIFRPLVTRIVHRVAIVDLLELLAVDGRRDPGGIETQWGAADHPLLHVPARARVGVAAQHFS